MPVDVVVAVVLSAGVITFAIWRGSMPERLGAAIIAVNLLVDLAVSKLGGGEWGFSRFSSSRFLVDVAEFALIFSLAWNANRVWPIFSAAAQLVAVGGSIAVWGSDGGMQVAYWAVTQLPLFGQLAALGVGTFVHARRQAVVGPYRHWRMTRLPHC